MAIKSGETTYHQAKRGIVQNGLVLNLDAGVDASYDGGTTWRDLEGGNNGTLTNGPTFDAGNGGSIVFDGANDNIVFSDKDEYSFGNGSSDSPFSIELYFNCDNVGSGAAFFKGLIGKDTSVYREWALLIVSSTKKVRVFIKNQGGGNQQSIDTTSALLDDTWYHVVATYNGVGGTSAYSGLKLYLNGDFENVSSASSQSYTAMSNTSANLTVGNYYGSNNYFNGNISVVRLYNRALTATEITQNYNVTRHRFGV